MARDLEALHRFFAERQNAPFEWGDHANDCVSFAAAAVVAQGGADLVAGMRWDSEDAAHAALDASGGLEAAVSGLLPFVAEAFAERGDIGAIPAGNGLILVVVEGDTVVGPGPRGIRRLPRSAMVRAWRAM
ncbi:DUF6950 family protein [Sphingomonas immobilis]|uniref:DUF6950 domain-containing protein n=1 Tax=Sphingomonas immobilis TaxID=3063997 RepID=A0ABT8ZX57_9SPHN|nr:hypothetical protein [Sphingomonas sp. CA1-15]MDO7841072.1 hypothetical protein [Sphingomonas sp. CA1-15]